MSLFSTRQWLSAFMLLLLTANAEAIPLFARKYNVTCFTCHVSPPMLNDFGRRFQSNGYQLPGSPADITPQYDNASFPFALVTHPMAAHEREEDNAYGTPTAVKTSVEELELELFSTASLGAHFSYWGEVEVELNGAENEIGIGTMYLLYTDVLGNGSGNLNFRLGKLPLLLPFSGMSFLSNTDPLIFEDNPFRNVGTIINPLPSIIRPSITGKATILEEEEEEEEEEEGGGGSSDQIASPRNELRLADPQFAVSAFGIFPEIMDGLRWEVAFSVGESNGVKLRDANAIYVGLNQSLPIPNTLANIGAFYYGGKQSVISSGYAEYPRANTLNRIGAHLEFYDPWFNRLHFYGMYVTGNDDNVDFFGKARKVNSVLAGIDAIILPETFYAFAHYDRLRAPDLAQSMDRIDAGFRYHLLPNMIATVGLTKTDSRYIRVIGITSVNADYTTTAATVGILFGF